MSQDANNIPKGLNITTQIPLDVKTYKESEDELSHLGDANQLAFTYVDGMRIYCVAEKTIWEWKEVPSGEEDTGLLFNGDFTYPSGVVTFGITYSNKAYNFFKVEYVNAADEKSYDATSLGTGGGVDNHEIYKDKTVSGNTTTFNFKGIKTENIGPGQPILNEVFPTADTVSIQAATLKSDNLEISLDVDGAVLINTPVDVNNVTFYVNGNSVATEETGTISKPFKSLKAAFTAYQGTGTILAPQYAQIGVIELLSDIVIPSTGPDAMTYMSINQLRIRGNGFTIYYRGTQDYFISTAYLVGLDAKTVSNKLDHTIFMFFDDVNIISETKHKMIYNLNYVSPTASGLQNSSGIEFNNCKIYDTAYLEDLASYSNVGTLFGSTVHAQNSLPTTNYMIVNKDINWYGEGGFSMRNCKLYGSSSTILYNLNTSTSWFDVEMNFSAYYVNYETLASSVYSPKDNLFYIINRTDGTSGRAQGYIRIENLSQTNQQGSSGGFIIGGEEAFCKIMGDSQLIIDSGVFYSDRVSNVIQIDSLDGDATLNYFDSTSVQVADATYGALKYIGSLPVTPKTVIVDGSNINSVKNWTTNQFIRVYAASATINGTYFNSLPTYPDNAGAISGGLVPGNIYFNTTGQIATRVA